MEEQSSEPLLNTGIDWKIFVGHYNGNFLDLTSINYKELLIIYEAEAWTFNYYVVFPGSDDNFVFTFTPHIDYVPTAFGGYGYIEVRRYALIKDNGTFNKSSLTVLYR